MVDASAGNGFYMFLSAKASRLFQDIPEEAEASADGIEAGKNGTSVYVILHVCANTHMCIYIYTVIICTHMLFYNDLRMDFATGSTILYLLISIVHMCLLEYS